MTIAASPPGGTIIQLPPHDLQAERACLDTALFGWGDNGMPAIADILAPHHFYDPNHGHIWSAALALHRRGEPTDPVTVAKELGPFLDKVGGRAALTDLANAAPAYSNAKHYAAQVVECWEGRQLIAIGQEIASAGYTGVSPAAAIERLQSLQATPIGIASDRLKNGDFLLDADATPESVWGLGSECLWAAGEPMMIAAPPGVGKTTLMGQLVAGLIGIPEFATVLGFPVARRTKVLYLASDRPRQATRALRRHFHHEHRTLLADRLAIWLGPPPADLAKDPEALVRLCRSAGADVVVLDSLKDQAVGLVDDAVAAGVNRAIQMVVAEGIEVAVLHHQRKAQNGSKPKALDDVYGSRWLTAGVGSVVMLWGEAGNPEVELLHLKQPADVVGPLKLEHDHEAGRTRISEGGFDALEFLRNRKSTGATATDAARAWTTKTNPSAAERRRAERRLKGLVDAGLARVRQEATRGGAGVSVAGKGGATGAVYEAIVLVDGRSDFDGRIDGRGSTDAFDGRSTDALDEIHISPGQVDGRSMDAGVGPVDGRTPPPLRGECPPDPPPGGGALGPLPDLNSDEAWR